jgi:hypothetical protein
MVAAKQSQGVFPKVKAIEQKNPLAQPGEETPNPKPKQKEKFEIVNEDRDLQRERTEATESSFPEGEAPKLEFLKYQLELTTPTQLPQITLSVHFRGTNVLEGFKECMKFGLVDKPPACVLVAQETATNTFEYNVG